MRKHSRSLLTLLLTNSFEMSKVETYGARTIGAACMDVIGAASILLEVYAQIFRIVASFLDQDLSGNLRWNSFSFSTFAFIMMTSDRLSAMRGRLSASRARVGSSLAGKSLFNSRDHQADDTLEKKYKVRGPLQCNAHYNEVCDTIVAGETRM